MRADSFVQIFCFAHHSLLRTKSKNRHERSCSSYHQVCSSLDPKVINAFDERGSEVYAVYHPGHVSRRGHVVASLCRCLPPRYDSPVFCHRSLRSRPSCDLCLSNLILSALADHAESYQLSDKLPSLSALGRRLGRKGQRCQSPGCVHAG